MLYHVEDDGEEIGLSMRGYVVTLAQGKDSVFFEDRLPTVLRFFTGRKILADGQPNTICFIEKRLLPLAKSVEARAIEPVPTRQRVRPQARLR